MYRPIAILHNERGLMTGFRIFQWGFGKLPNLTEDCISVGINMVSETSLHLPNSRIFDLLFSEVPDIKVCGNFSRFISECKLSIPYVTSMSNILADGSVVNDTLTVFERSYVHHANKVHGGKSREVLVVDVNGSIASYTESDLAVLCNHANLKIGLDVKEGFFYGNGAGYTCTQGINYATEEFKSRLRQFLDRCELAGTQCIYYEKDGRLVYDMGNEKELLVPDLVSGVLMASRDYPISKLCMPDICDLWCTDSVISELRAPVHSNSFQFITKATVKELTLPKYMGEYVIGCDKDSCRAIFTLSVPNLPDDITCIDQRNYKLRSNVITVLRGNNVQRAVLSLGSTGTQFYLTNAASLKEIQLFSPFRLCRAHAEILMHKLGSSLRIQGDPGLYELCLTLGYESSGMIWIDDCNSAEVQVCVGFEQFVSSGSRLVLVVTKSCRIFELKDTSLLNQVYYTGEGKSLDISPNYSSWVTVEKCSKGEVRSVIDDFYAGNKRFLILFCEVAGDTSFNTLKEST